MKVSGEVLPTYPGGGHPASGVAPFLLGLAYYPLAYWSVMGMETGLLTIFLLAGILAAFRYVASGSIRLLSACSALLGLAFLTRNDSVVVSLLILGYILWASPRDHRRGGRARWLLPVLAFFLVIAGQAFFQYGYYGEFLPNTYTLKLTGLALPIRIRGGLGFVALFLRETWLAFAIAMAGMIARFRREKLLLLLIALRVLGYQMYIGGDPWNYWRMLAPVMPLVLILAMDGLFVIYRGTWEWSATRISHPRAWRLCQARSANSAVGIAGLMVLLVLNWRFLPEMTFRVKPYQSVRNAENVNIAIALNELLSPEASVGVFWAGAIPYFTERRAVDFLGKSDRRIASLAADVSGRTSWWGMKSVPGHNKYDLQYSIVELAPTYVQGFAYGGEDLTEWGEQNYARIIHRGIPLFLLRAGHGIQWDRRPGHFSNAALIK
jgi:hypothetical protein